MRRALVHYPQAFRVRWTRVPHDVRYGKSGRSVGDFVGFIRRSHARGEGEENGMGEGSTGFIHSTKRRDVFSGARINSFSTQSH
jgi:hypothetical protein